MSDIAVTFSDVLVARLRIKHAINTTPVITSNTFNQLANLSLFFKCENFQKVGAFKYRGACNAVLQLSDEEAQKGVVTHSSGNHAQALALAAKVRGIKAHVVMPSNSPVSKKNAIQGYGAEITLCAPNIKSREETCEKIQQKFGATFISSSNAVGVIAGQGTVALELMEQVKDLDAIVAPVSGGGLLSGICIAAKGINPKIAIFGAEPTGADDTYQSFISGKLVTQTNPETICDGLRANLGNLTWPIIKKHCTGILTATDEEVKNAMFLLWERNKIVVEPSGAISTAVVLNPNFKKNYPHLKRIGILISGGNLDLKEWNWKSNL